KERLRDAPQLLRPNAWGKAPGELGSIDQPLRLRVRADQRRWQKHLFFPGSLRAPFRLSCPRVAMLTRRRKFMALRRKQPSTSVTNKHERRRFAVLPSIPATNLPGGVGFGRRSPAASVRPARNRECKPMEKFTTLTGVAAPLPIDNI